MSEAASEAAPASSLAGHERLTVARARQLAGISSADAVRDYTGHADTAMAYACAFGEAVFLLAELAAIAERLAAETALPVTPAGIHMLMMGLASLDYCNLTEAEQSERADLTYKLGTLRPRTPRRGKD